MRGVGRKPNTASGKGSAQWFNTMRNTLQTQEAFSAAASGRKRAGALVPAKCPSQPLIAKGSKRIFKTKSITQTPIENNIIKKKMEEYNAATATVKSSRKYEFNVVDSLKHQASQITSLLAKSNPTVELSLSRNETAKATRFVPYSAKVKCRNCPVPFKVNVAVHRGVNSSRLYFSLSKERPSAQCFDKLVMLSRAAMSVSFADKMSKEEKFRAEWIYIGLETQDKCSATFDWSFGKSINTGEDVKVKTEGTVSKKAVNINKVVDIMISRIVANPQLLHSCQANALLIQRKRRIRTARDRKSGALSIDCNSRNMSSGLKLVRLHKDKVKLAITQRNRIETEAVTRQFLMANKKLINAKYVLFYHISIE